MGPPLLDLDDSSSCGPEGLAGAEVELTFKRKQNRGSVFDPLSC